jgi:cytochrome c
MKQCQIYFKAALPEKELTFYKNYDSIKLSFNKRIIDNKLFFISTFLYLRSYYMKKNIYIAALMVMVFGSVMGILYAVGTKEEASANVKKAIEYYKANGKEKAFKEISNPKGMFVKGDLYIFVYDLNGNCVAHGFNAKMIGKSLIDAKDPDGKLYVKERVTIAKTKGSGWQNYKFTNPTTYKIEKKSAYVEKIDNYVFGCGAYE